MSEPQVVGTVLLPVPLYEVDGRGVCDGRDANCPFWPCASDELGCTLLPYADDYPEPFFFALNEGDATWWQPAHPDCPLRAPGVLTLADLWVLAAGRPKVDWIEHRDRTAEWGECPACGARSGCGSDEHDIYDEAVGPTCPTLRAQREYDDAAARRDALLEKYR